MCGFFGEFSPGGQLLGERSFRALLDLSVRRGPDAQHVYRDQRCGLGFNRLAILDLSPEAMQPMLSPSGRFVVVFNGEIYNFIDLARRYGLEREPHCLTSDTAVVAHLTDQLSVEELAEALDGMFSIAVYDREQTSLSLIRDFAGIKPLFYGAANDRIVFASQFDQVFHHPAIVGRGANSSAVRDYLQLGYMPAPGTLLEGISQVEPGNLVTFDHSLKARAQGYSDFGKIQNGDGLLESSAEASGELANALESACRNTLVADVPLACFVSGGIDSPLVAAIARQESPSLRGFTVGVEDELLNEADIARGYCEALQIDQTILNLTAAEIVDQLDSHFEALPDPIGDYSTLPTFAITREAKQHATVMLSGDGGDELFWGYPRFYKFMQARKALSLPRPLRVLASRGARLTGMKMSHGITDGLGPWVLDTQSRILSSDLDQILPGATTNSPSIQNLYRFDGDYSPEAMAHWIRYNEFYGHLQGVLAKVDRASMGNSLEVRVPFLCKDVMKLAWKLRFDSKNREPKLLLKRALSKRLPAMNANQKKMGFTVPVSEWLRTSLKDEVRGTLDRPVFATDLMDVNALRDFVDRYYRGEHDYSWALWILYSLQKWASVHLNRKVILPD